MRKDTKNPSHFWSWNKIIICNKISERANTPVACTRLAQISEVRHWFSPNLKTKNFYPKVTGGAAAQELWNTRRWWHEYKDMEPAPQKGAGKKAVQGDKGFDKLLQTNVNGINCRFDAVLSTGE